MHELHQKPGRKTVRRYGKLIKGVFPAAFIILSGFLYSCGHDKPHVYEAGDTYNPVSGTVKEDYTGETSGPDANRESAQCIYVYVCGCVNSPGVYELGQEARVYTLIEMAGGLTQDADVRRIAMAGTVTDGQTLYIPSVDELTELPDSGEALGKSKLNINTATKEQLMTLRGIGESRAEDIIAYRTQNGRFAKPEDIMKVNGIKEAAYSRIKDDICVN